MLRNFLKRNSYCAFAGLNYELIGQAHLLDFWRFNLVLLLQVVQQCTTRKRAKTEEPDAYFQAGPNFMLPRLNLSESTHMTRHPDESYLCFSISGNCTSKCFCNWGREELASDC